MRTSFPEECRLAAWLELIDVQSALQDLPLPVDTLGYCSPAETSPRILDALGEALATGRLTRRDVGSSRRLSLAALAIRHVAHACFFISDAPISVRALRFESIVVRCDRQTIIALCACKADVFLNLSESAEDATGSGDDDEPSLAV